ncbi:Preprotein translocase subunit SecY [Shewanella sp. GXUN23E]|uniref:Preprotein translocase subunit SecY n=1 Tax=Shewanella sp. GXUN23E TaxID=3422498 RepID=UPI003D7EDAD5
MHYQDSIGLRYPKGPLATTTVWSLAGASILASTIFSLLLFLSIDDNPVMKWLFGSLAVIFEAGKFYAWYEFGERRAHRNYPGALSALMFYLVLAVISIGGSIGGINSATNSAQEHIAIEQAKVNAYDRQIAAIDNQIALNNLAAEKYIEMERIATGVTRIQEQNKRLREEQQRLAAERDSLPPVAQGSIIGLIDSMANLLGVDTRAAQLGLVVFLSVLLDFFAAFFVGVIGEELRFRHFWRVHRPLTIDAISEPLPSITPVLTLQSMPADSDNHEPELSLSEQVSQALANRALPCSKRAVAKHFGLMTEEVDTLFAELLASGQLGKKANNHYHWIGTEA